MGGRGAPDRTVRRGMPRRVRGSAPVPHARRRRHRRGSSVVSVGAQGSSACGSSAQRPLGKGGSSSGAGAQGSSSSGASGSSSLNRLASVKGAHRPVDAARSGRAVGSGYDVRDIAALSARISPPAPGTAHPHGVGRLLPVKRHAPSRFCFSHTSAACTSSLITARRARARA